jgi:GPH family glycoside/pentoside/hexuronide:cation symporter
MKEKENNQIGYSNKKAVSYSFGQIADIVSYQTFTFLIFTFYYTIVGLNVIFISIGFIIWSVWNSLNDPLIGFLSDRTHTRWGRRLPYMMVALIPLGFIMFLLFSPPMTLFGITDSTTNLIYFLVIIIIFDLVYTMFSLNLTSLFPESFITADERTKANNIRQLFGLIGLIMVFVLPGFIIPDITDPKYYREYSIFGAIIMIIVIACGLIFLKFGPKEKPEFQQDYKKCPGFFGSIKMCAQSKSFRWYIPCEVATWFIFGMVPTIIPLYAKFVLNVENTLMISLLMGIVFISAAIFMTLLWRPIVRKIGVRKTWIISMIVLIISMAPLMFITDFISGIIVFFFIGVGFAGSLYIIDLVVSDIIDEDEVKTGMRRDAGFYGVNALFLRLSTIFVFLCIGLVFTNVGWAVYEPENVTPAVIFGLRVLIFIFPAIALIIGIIVMYKYPLDGERLRKVKEDLQKVHSEKKSKI